MKTKSNCAFTCLELIVVVTVSVLVLGLFVLPSLARSKARSPAAGCLSNLRQLMTGWQMYTDENRGRVILNSPNINSTSNWYIGTEGWGNNPANINPASITNGLMGPYVGNNYAVFRCPGDVIPSQNGFRLRSYTMNGQVGLPPGQPNFGAPLRAYSYESDITCPSPKDLFVLCDEHPGSIDDSYFQVSATTGYFPNVPASYLDGGCGFSFADGHAEIHKWQGTGLLIPVAELVRPGPVTHSAGDPDAIWFHGKVGCQ
jgi:prepilin-type processing-associated H-X9-DG protein